MGGLREASSINPQSTIELVGNYGLAVQPGNTLALVGGNVSFDGGVLTARGGRIELGGVAGSGTVDLSVNGNDLHLSFPNGIEPADVSLTNANIYANSPLVRSVPEIPAGSIAINARNIDVSQGGYIGASGDPSSTNSNTRKAGEITLNATEAISVTGTAEESTIFQVDGNRGVIKIKSKSISLTDSLLSTVDFGGYAGDIFLQADETLSLANSFVLSNIGYGKAAGEINLNGRSISITGTSQINAFGTFGVSGTININASDSVSISGSGSRLNTFAVDYGRGGDINIRAKSFSLKDGASLKCWD